jgi:hypothetical protein
MRERPVEEPDRAADADARRRRSQRGRDEHEAVVGAAETSTRPSSGLPIRLADQ